jgi:hypothetical protein
MDKFLLTAVQFDKEDFRAIKKYFSSDTAWAMFCEMLKDEKKITIAKVKKIRSEEQNAYYWGGVIPFIHALKPFKFLEKKKLSDKISTKTSEFGGQMKRVGRCNYICDKCGDDVSMLWAFYSLSQEEERQDRDTFTNNIELLAKMGITPPSKGDKMK